MLRLVSTKSVRYPESCAERNTVRSRLVPADGTVPQFIFISSTVKRRLRILLCLIQFIGYKRMPHYICLLGKKRKRRKFNVMLGEGFLWSGAGASQKEHEVDGKTFTLFVFAYLTNSHPEEKWKSFTESIFRSQGISAEPALCGWCCGIAFSEEFTFTLLSIR